MWAFWASCSEDQNMACDGVKGLEMDSMIPKTPDNMYRT